jgi:hypothetical protein
LKIALFLGAGASAPFDKPTTAQMKEILLTQDFKQGFHDFIIKSLLQVEKFSDIEYVLQAITEIVNFSNSSGYDYFSSLGYNANFRHQMLVYSGSSYSFDQVVAELRNVYDTLKRQIFKNYSWKPEDNRKLSSIYDRIFSIFKDYDSKIKIFTTNYDQAIESYCEKKDELRLVDGFKYDENKQKHIWTNGDYAYYDNVVSNKKNVYLYKLHGSLNWKEHILNWIERTSEETITTDPKYPTNMLIYPTLTPKDGLEKEPYKSVYHNFVNYMKDADMCIVIGFSFRDHLNDVFKEFMGKKKLFVAISPNVIKDFHVNLLKLDPSDNSAPWTKWNSTTRIESNPINKTEKWDVTLVPNKLLDNSVSNIINEIHNAFSYTHHP